MQVFMLLNLKPYTINLKPYTLNLSGVEEVRQVFQSSAIKQDDAGLYIC